MSKRILVTGASGFVGGSVLHHAPAAWEVHACSRGLLEASPPNVIHHRFDLADVDATADVIGSVKPDAILHIAAIANIDYAEAHPAEATVINTETTGRLAHLAREHGTRFVFCSTDNVFDGWEGRYPESHPVCPVNFYGGTKVEAEIAIQSTLEDAAIARVALVIGLPVMGSGNSFLQKMADSFRDGQEIRIPENEIRSPIDVLTLGKSLLELADNDFRGVINLAGSTCLNRYDMAKQIAAKLGHTSDQVVPINSNALEGRAPRPDDVSLDNSLARDVLRTPMRDLDDALDLIFNPV